MHKKAKTIINVLFRTTSVPPLKKLFAFITTKEEKRLEALRNPSLFVFKKITLDSPDKTYI